MPFFAALLIKRFSLARPGVAPCPKGAPEVERGRGTSIDLIHAAPYASRNLEKHEPTLARESPNSRIADG